MDLIITFMKHLLLLFLSLLCLPTLGQDATLKVWPDKIPGAIQNADYANDAKTSGGWLTKVTDPIIEVYAAPEALATGTAVVICPGGGYSGLAFQHEGVQVAKWFSSLGITAFLLKYRLPSDLIMEDKSIGPLQDVQEAIRIVRRNAAAWKVDPDKVGVMGFSAGGHLASTASTKYDEKVYTPIDKISARPDFSILIYPVISMHIGHEGSKHNLIGAHPSAEMIDRFSSDLQVNENTPPAFLVHSVDDDVVRVENSIRYLLALKEHKVPGELHLYEKGGHGYGLGRKDDTTNQWPKACEEWLKMNGFL